MSQSRTNPLHLDPNAATLCATLRAFTLLPTVMLWCCAQVAERIEQRVWQLSGYDRPMPRGLLQHLVSKHCVCQQLRWQQLHFCVWLPGRVSVTLEGCMAP